MTSAAVRRRVRVVGVGMGPHHVTPEAAAALRASDYVIAAQKAAEDPLLEVRREICRLYGDLPVVAVADPARDRADPADYGRAVRDWHEARVAVYEKVLADRDGDAALLVWGDPSLYDSTIRILDGVRARGRVAVEYDVVPGISALQLLAARHRIVLHEVGRPVHVTTARRLREAISQGQENIVVVLGRTLDLGGLEDWTIWWGANLGTPSEALVAGRVGEVVGRLEAARERARSEAGWVMDICLLRRSAAS